MQNQRHVDGVADGLDHGLLDVRIARVHAVAGANANGQRGAAGTLDELLGLGRIGVGALALNRGTVVLLAANLTELSLDGHVHGAASIGDGLGQGNVVLEGLVRTVDHDRGVARAESLHAAVIAIAVIEVQSDGHGSALGGSLDHAVEVVQTSGLDGARGGLHDDGGLGLLGSGQNGHNKLEVLDVERADGVVAGLSVLEHLFGGNKCHERLLLSLARIWTSGVVVHKAFYLAFCCAHCMKIDGVARMRYHRHTGQDTRF